MIVELVEAEDSTGIIYSHRPASQDSPGELLEYVWSNPIALDIPRATLNSANIYTEEIGLR